MPLSLSPLNTSRVSVDLIEIKWIKNMLLSQDNLVSLSGLSEEDFVNKRAFSEYIIFSFQKTVKIQFYKCLI